MDFDSEGEDGGDDFYAGFDALVRREANKIESALRDLDDQLYTETTVNAPPPVDEGISADTQEIAPQTDEDDDVEDTAMNVIREYQRFDAVGYEAHLDAVSKNEILQWQWAFPYLRVQGTAIDVTTAMRHLGGRCYRICNWWRWKWKANGSK